MSIYVKKHMNKIFVDTNILIYSIDEDSKFYSKSQKILFNPNSQLYTSSKNLSEFLSVVTRFPTNALSIKDALIAIEDFTNIFTILYPTKISFSIFKELLQKYKPKGLKIHDFEIVSIVLANEINQIATFNIKDFESIEEISLIPNQSRN